MNTHYVCDFHPPFGDGYCKAPAQEYQVPGARICVFRCDAHKPAEQVVSTRELERLQRIEAAARVVAFGPYYTSDEPIVALRVALGALP